MSKSVQWLTAAAAIALLSTPALAQPMRFKNICN